MLSPGSLQADRFGNAGAAFATTHWSVVLAAGDSGSPRAAEALEQLCRTYWHPLYAYVRRQGRSPEDAQDLTQEFFARFLEKNYFSRAERQRGRFRTFLLTSLQHFLAHEWERTRAEKRGGGRTPLPWDEATAETRYQLEEPGGLTADGVFEKGWAFALFQRALARMQQEYATAGKADQFEQLKPYLQTEAGQRGYAAVAERLETSPGAVAVAIHRLRQRYGQLVREEVAHTVTSPSEVEEEVRYLIGLMTG
ncbi:MAG TPA: sigma-70 family RNA polymerase sigma factor [Verrucomicrobiae bacterium]